MIPRIGAMLRRRFHRAGLSERRCELTSASVRCFVGDTGGPPLLLLMGFGASVEWQFHPNVAALARRHQLIIPDLVHFGGSESEETPCREAFCFPKRSYGQRSAPSETHWLPRCAPGQIFYFFKI